MPTTTYTTIDGQIVSENRAGTQKFYGPDPLGSVVTIYDTTGTVTDTFVYWPYGEIRTSTGSTATPFKFCGTWGYYSDATGRLYVRARFYRDKIARWQTVDLVWPKLKPYAYPSSPVRVSDPTGMRPKTSCLKSGLECDKDCCDNNPDPWGLNPEAGLLCCGGQACICIYRVPPYSDFMQIRECICQHERDHFADVKPCGCGEVDAPDVIDPGPWNECRAYQVGIICLHDCFESEVGNVRIQCYAMMVDHCRRASGHCGLAGMLPMPPPAGKICEGFI